MINVRDALQQETAWRALRVHVKSEGEKKATSHFEVSIAQPEKARAVSGIR